MADVLRSVAQIIDLYLFALKVFHRTHEFHGYIFIGYYKTVWLSIRKITFLVIMNIIWLPQLCAYMCIFCMCFNGIIMPLCGLLCLAIGGCLLVSYNTFLWLGMAFFLIYVGGLMVLFTYFTAISGASSLSLSWVKVLLVTVVIWYLHDFLPPEQIDVLHPSHIFSNLRILTFCVVILLYSLIVVVRLSRQAKGPLR